MEASKIKFRCSSLGHLMTDPKTNKAKEAGELAETVKTHLVDVYVSNMYNRFTEISAKQLDKGNETEEDSITTVSRITKDFYKKNELFIENDFIKGTPDLFTGESIYNAETIRDTKSSWDAYSFFRAKAKPLNKMYYWQVLGYMWLTGASKGSVDYCLNNTPYHLVESELRKESYNHVGNDTPAWIELQIIANHVYDKATFDIYREARGCNAIDSSARAIVDSFVEIPFKDRWFNFDVERNEADIELLKNRILKARDYIENKLFKDELIEA
jgi:lysophospholipase L1-like esterase